MNEQLKLTIAAFTASAMLLAGCGDVHRDDDNEDSWSSGSTGGHSTVTTPVVTGHTSEGTVGEGAHGVSAAEGAHGGVGASAHGGGAG